MKLWQISLILGVVCVLTHLYAVLRPKACAEFLPRLPRNIPLGVYLTLLATAWFEYNLFNSDISDFAEWKPLMLLGLGIVGVGTCFYVRDYIAVRGGAAVTFLVADLVLDIQRWHPSPWKNVITIWMYVWIVGAGWMVVQPWRARDAIAWVVRVPQRFRAFALAGLAFGLVVIGLGLTILQ